MYLYMSVVYFVCSGLIGFYLAESHGSTISLFSM